MVTEAPFRYGPITRSLGIDFDCSTEEAEVIVAAILDGSYGNLPDGYAKGKIGLGFRLAFREANVIASEERRVYRVDEQCALNWAMDELNLASTENVPLHSIVETVVSECCTILFDEKDNDALVEHFDRIKRTFWNVLGYDDIPEQSLAV